MYSRMKGWIIFILILIIIIVDTSAITTRLSKNSSHSSPHRTKLMKLPATKELLKISNSGGYPEVPDKGGGGGTDDEDEKTLSQQVSEGKYGLIHKELFPTKVQRPGIISYDVNPEVPKDNINSLGGLEEEDIWLAENHLLVLSGAAFANKALKWTPIDSYISPPRQVQIPLNPKIPPPFPVQFTDNGPIHYVNTSKAQFNPPFRQFPPFMLPNFPIPSLYSPSNQSIFPPPFFGPPGIPPPSFNASDYDEDDPSLYYPPRYDFYYPIDNTSRVPAGPLVPGIVLPPPPDFFSLQTEKSPSGFREPSPNKNKPSIKPINFSKTAKYLQDSFMRENKYRSKKPSLQSTTEPSSTTPYLDSENEVLYQKSNPIDEQWVPIPAPRSQYITEPIKPLKDLTKSNVPSSFDSGYIYKKPVKPFEPYTYTTPEIGEIRIPSKDKQLSKYYSKFQSKGDTNVPLHRTPKLSTVAPPSPMLPKGSTIQATYYFYEEPQYIDSYDVGPPQNPIYSKPTPSSVAPVQFIPSTTPEPKFIKSNKYPAIGTIPIYYLAELQNEPSTTSIPNSYSINKPPSPIRSTPKPIFEFSYVAPGYKPFEYNAYADVATETPSHFLSALYDFTSSNSPSTTTESPLVQLYEKPSYEPYFTSKLSSYPSSTTASPIDDYRKPVHKVQFYPISKHPTTESPLNSYYVNQNKVTYPTSNLPAYQSSTTESPIDYFYPVNNHPNEMYQSNPPSSTTPSPFIQLYNRNPGYRGYPSNPSTQYYAQHIYTENPFYAFFTKEDEELIDDNTKKYFTIFGQKLKQESTTASSGGGGWQSFNPFKDQRQSSSDEDTKASRSKPTPTRDISLQRDILVNYLNPMPTIEPDAEIISNSEQSKPEESSSSGYHYPKPADLSRDTLVNYKNPRPNFNENAEYIDQGNQYVYYASSQYGERVKGPQRPPAPAPAPYNLQKDTLVNYRQPLPPINPDAELISENQYQLTVDDTQDFQSDAENPGKYYKREKSKIN